MRQQRSRFRRQYFYFYLLILIWAPLPYGSNVPWAWSLLTLLCFALVAAMAIAMLKQQFDPGKKLRPFRFPILLFSLVPIWVTIQSIPMPENVVAWVSPHAHTLFENAGAGHFYLSLEPALTFQFALLSWAFWLFFICTVLLVDSQERLQKLLTVIVLCGVFQALYGSLMTLSGLEYGFFLEKTDYIGRATGTFINRNHLAGYLEMCLAAGIGLLVASLHQGGYRNWQQRLAGWLDTLLGPKLRLRIYLALMVIALVLTRSRMGNTAFFVSLTVCGALMIILQRRLSKGALILFASLLAVDFFIVGQWFGFEELAQRMQTTSAETESRDEVTRDTLPMIRDFMITGTGVRTYYSAFQQYNTEEYGKTYDHAHNDYLEFAGDFGLMGYIPLALLVLTSTGTAVLALYKRKSKLAQGAAFASMMGILSLMIHSSVDFNLQMPANGLLFVTLLALAWIARHIPHEEKDRQ